MTYVISHIVRDLAHEMSEISHAIPAAASPPFGAEASGRAGLPRSGQHAKYRGEQGK